MNLNEHREIWVSEFGGFLGCSIVSGICCHMQGCRVIFRKRALYLVALLLKEACNLWYKDIVCDRMSCDDVRRCITCLALQVSFRKRATKYRALLRKITHTNIRISCDDMRRCTGSLKLQVSFRKRATKYRALLRKMTYTDNRISCNDMRRSITMYLLRPFWL